ncbi:MAG: archemetzincin [Bryobacteraceae bacterium]|nr:MAG: archemetzincin [Bryobacteraceae bacterium]
MIVLGLFELQTPHDPALPQGVIPAMAAALESCLPVRVAGLKPLQAPADAFDAKRGQWSAPALLENILASLPDGIPKALGVTGSDLFIPMLSFVYGQAQLKGRAGVVSVARLRQEYYGLPPNSALLLERARKEAVHEAGHLLGLVHCSSPGCVMRLSVQVGQIDLKGEAPCPACAARLREVTA